MTYLGEEIPKLGFGLMRLPRNEKEIDIGQVEQMVNLFLQAGFTYFDTAYAYDGSEAAIKKALVERYPRESYQLATKLAAWLGPKTAEEAKAMLATSLERTGAGYFDFYLLHNLGVERIKAFDEFGLWDWVQEQKKAGLVKHVGFSCHDHADFLDEVLTAYPEMEFVQLQVNYADWDDPVVESRRCLEVARKHGKPVIIMEPVKGGSLVELPEAVADILKQADPEASAASWALRFAASQPGLITVLSGMSNVEQMKQNLATMTDFKPLSEAELEVISAAQNVLAKLPHVLCTDCRYCTKGCPQSIAIPSIFDAYNKYLMYGNVADAKMYYGFATGGGQLASSCTQCGACEVACPQSIDIIAQLEKVADTFE